MSFRSSILFAGALSSALLASACLDGADDGLFADDEAETVGDAEPEPDEAVSAAIGDKGSGYLRTAQGIMPVAYRRVGDSFVIQGDILVDPADFVRNWIAPENLVAEAQRAVNERGAVRAIGGYRWPGDVIPYQIAPGFSASQITAINDAMAHWSSKTYFTFHLKTSGDPDFVTFKPTSGAGACFSHLGRKSGEQFIELEAGCGKGEIIHEIGHAVGFIHEHQRTDRDQYVTINIDNVDPDFKYAFDKFVVQYGGDGANAGSYDYASIMHYGAFDFSINGLRTITAPQTIGQRIGLSQGDIDAARRISSEGGVVADDGLKVTLYRDNGNVGISQSFLPGYYVTDQLDIVGDNQTSGIKVPPGLGVELWAGSVNEPHQFFYENTPTLPTAFNNKVSSIFVVRAVTAFRESSLWGVQQSFRPGTYKLSAGQMSTVGIGVSSILIPPGMTVDLCSSESGTGCQTFEGSVSFVGSTLNDNVRMIRVNAGVTTYSEIDFNAGVSGARKTYPIGVYTGHFLPNVSSLKTDRDIQVKACYFVNGTGCVIYRGDVNYVGDTMNDAIQYIKVEANTGP
jgi:astacin (peptidase family M12A)